jgi:oligoribonuclease
LGDNGAMNDEATAKPPALAKNAHNLVWIDCEMSGLDPERERLLEVAMVVTGPQLWPVVPGPVVVVHQSDALLGAMDAWNTGTHTRSGLVDKVRQSAITEAQAEAVLLDFMRQYVPERASPMCGNTIGQDRRFLVRYMPQLEAYFHYRNLDVSTLKELARRWRPELLTGFVKRQAHTALADVMESIDELAYYRQHLLQAPVLAEVAATMPHE